MNLLAAFQAFTQREKLLLAGLGLAVLITGFVYVFPLFFPEKTISTQIQTLPTAAKQVIAAEMPVKTDLPAASVKNPFLVPPQYQVRKETPNAASGSSATAGLPAQKPVNATPPVLSGIMASGSTKMAILELGGSSDTLGIGGTLGGYTVTSITDSQVVLNGPEGRMVLNIGR
jgi:hypothetical protein